MHARQRIDVPETQIEVNVVTLTWNACKRVALPSASGDARRLLRSAGSRDKRLVLFPGAFHGWQIVEEAPYAPTARRLVLKWIRARAA